VHYLTSPTIGIPADAIHPTMAFTHYIASEPALTGNVQIRSNGGAWQLIPAASFEYNAYNTTLQSTLAGNTNPLAGQVAWSGAGGQWGTSLIDLGGLVNGGDSIQIRFRFGKDGCNGVQGWYIDDFQVYTCPPEPPTASNISASTGADTPVTITLVAQDEGPAGPPGALNFIIALCPAMAR